MALMNSDLMMGQLLFPIVAAAFRNAKGNRAHLSATDTTRMSIGPWEKGNDRAISMDDCCSRDDTYKDHQS